MKGEGGQGGIKEGGDDQGLRLGGEAVMKRSYHRIAIKKKIKDLK